MSARGDAALKVLAITVTSTRRMLRDRSSWFFLLVFPLLLVLVLGSAFGSEAQPEVGVAAPADDPFAEEVLTELGEADLDLTDHGSEDSLRRAVEHGEATAGVSIPDGFGERLLDGTPAVVEVLEGPSAEAAAVRPLVDAAVAPTAARMGAAWFTHERAGSSRGTGGHDTPESMAAVVDRAAGLQADVEPFPVRTTTVGDELFPDTLGQFDVSASTQLTLFVFVNGLTSSLALILSRQYGVTNRMVATPTSARVVITGEMCSRLAVTLFQGLYIMVMTRLLFDVSWGDPPGALATIFAFALVPASAGMLLGATASHEQQAMGVSVILGLVLAALGGSMVPIEFFSPTMERIAQLTPHAWANAAFAELVRDDGGLLDVLPDLGVLLAMSAALLALATRRLRRVIAAA